MNVSKLLSIAKRQFRKGTERYEISDIVNLGDQLEIETLPPNVSAAEIVEKAERELAREVVRARKTTFRMLLENRSRNRDNNPERDVLFGEIVAAVQGEYPSWEMVFARNVINTARHQFDIAISGRPVEYIGGPHDSLPPCTVCHVGRADAKRLNFETWQVEPMCHDCATAQVRELS
jgi:hypothetical protein